MKPSKTSCDPRVCTILAPISNLCHSGIIPSQDIFPDRLHCKLKISLPLTMKMLPLRLGPGYCTCDIYNPPSMRLDMGPDVSHNDNIRHKENRSCASFFGNHSSSIFSVGLGRAVGSRLNTILLWTPIQK